MRILSEPEKQDQIRWFVNGLSDLERLALGKYVRASMDSRGDAEKGKLSTLYGGDLANLLDQVQDLAERTGHKYPVLRKELQGLLLSKK
jgi:hypothetical protein